MRPKRSNPVQIVHERVGIWSELVYPTPLLCQAAQLQSNRAARRLTIPFEVPILAAVSDALDTPSLTQFTIIIFSDRIPAASLIALASIG